MARHVTYKTTSGLLVAVRRDVEAGRRVTVSAEMVGYIVEAEGRETCRAMSVHDAKYGALCGQPDLSEAVVRKEALRRLKRGRGKTLRDLMWSLASEKTVERLVPTRFARREVI